MTNYASTPETHLFCRINFIKYSNLYMYAKFRLLQKIWLSNFLKQANVAKVIICQKQREWEKTNYL